MVRSPEEGGRGMKLDGVVSAPIHTPDFTLQLQVSGFVQDHAQIPRRTRMPRPTGENGAGQPSPTGLGAGLGARAEIGPLSPRHNSRG